MLVDEVDYNDKAPWPTLPLDEDETGAIWTIQRTRADSFGRQCPKLAGSLAVDGNAHAAPMENTSQKANLVISEIMYNPTINPNAEGTVVDPNDHLEYIELYNRGATALTLTGAKIGMGVEYTFIGRIRSPRTVTSSWCRSIPSVVSPSGRRSFPRTA